MSVMKWASSTFDPTLIVQAALFSACTAHIVFLPSHQAMGFMC